MSWSEDSLHRWLLRRSRPGVLAGSRGHDAAVLRALRGRPVVCVDQTLVGVHALPEARPGDLGRKAANRALSDLAATAARPRALTLALAAPAELEERWLRAVIAGVAAAAEACGADLVAGDLSGTPGPASLSVTAIGELAGRRRPPGRDRARPGQRLVLTGPVGGSLAGRHLRFRPRLTEGRALWEAGATAMMDISDGLAWDLHRLARASGVQLLLERVPVHRDARRASRESGRSPLEHALHDGEDHELVATLPAGAALPAGTVEIGRVREGRGLLLGGELAEPPRRWDPAEGGWRHGD
jgi:thiamine-monophosphate kinase